MRPSSWVSADPNPPVAIATSKPLSYLRSVCVDRCQVRWFSRKELPTVTPNSTAVMTLQPHQTANRHSLSFGHDTLMDDTLITQRVGRVKAASLRATPGERQQSVVQVRTGLPTAKS